jgi:hypothetical protein
MQRQSLRRAIINIPSSLFLADVAAMLAYASMREAHHAINHHRRGRGRSPILNASVDAAVEPRQRSSAEFLGRLGTSLRPSFRGAGIGTGAGGEPIPPPASVRRRWQSDCAGRRCSCYQQYAAVRRRLYQPDFEVVCAENKRAVPSANNPDF